METRLPPLQIGVAVVITNREGLVLLGKRRGSHGAGTWSVPGGHVDPGETVEHCARRETFEETGIVLKGTVLPLGWNETHFVEEEKRYVTLYMSCSEQYPTAEVKEPDKCEEWCWFRQDHLPSPLFKPLDRFLSSAQILEAEVLSQLFDRMATQ